MTVVQTLLDQMSVGGARTHICGKDMNALLNPHHIRLTKKKYRNMRDMADLPTKLFLFHPLIASHCLETQHTSLDPVKTNSVCVCVCVVQLVK